MNCISTWIRAARVPTLTASVIPVALGGILAGHEHYVYPLRIILAAIAMTFFQIASNLVNDVDDFNNRVDTKESLGSSRVIVDGLLTQRQVITAAKIFFLSAVAIGIFLTAVSGLVILILGALGAASAYFYTRKPFSFKYRGYGIPLVFLMFGPLPVLGSYYLSAGMINLKPILLSIPVGLLTTAILHANDLRDIEHDARAGVRSFAMTLGFQRARCFYLSLILAAFLSVLVFIILGLLSCWSFLILLSIPFAVMLIHTSHNPRALKALDHKTAGLQMLLASAAL
jgi:1,4-dihydroxy-2-naphthoate octaprenyltransferase